MGHKKRASKFKQSRAKRTAAPETLAEFLAKPDKFQDTWNRATQVVSKMRSERISLQQASRDFQISSRIVVRLAGSALRKGTNRKYTAAPDDDLLRVLLLPSSDGLREIATRDSRQATVIGKYWSAVQKYLATGDASALNKIRRKTITDADGKRIRLLKDLAELERLASAGVLSFESLYAKVA
jgi:hypothetical protein